jgi:uncharacterized protein (DUF58 family)
MFKVHAAGAVFVVISVVLGILALNSGNNFHYLAAALVLGYTTAAGEAAKRNIKGAVVSLSFPDEIYASTPFFLTIVVRNSKRRSAVTFLDVSVCGKLAFFPMIPPGESRSASVSVSLNGRGVNVVDRVVLSSIYPFNIFTCSVASPMKESVVVFPAPVRDGEGARFLSLDDDDHSLEAQAANRMGESIADSDITGVRPYAEGDSMRIIHWKSSARTGLLKSRLYDAPSGGKIIDLERLVERGIERGLSAASGEIRETMASGGAIGLLCRGVIHAPSSARPDMLSMLEALALYE